MIQWDTSIETLNIPITSPVGYLDRASKYSFKLGPRSIVTAQEQKISFHQSTNVSTLATELIKEIQLH